MNRWIQVGSTLKADDILESINIELPFDLPNVPKHLLHLNFFNS